MFVNRGNTKRKKQTIPNKYTACFTIFVNQLLPTITLLAEGREKKKKIRRNRKLLSLLIQPCFVLNYSTRLSFTLFRQVFPSFSFFFLQFSSFSN